MLSFMPQTAFEADFPPLQHYCPLLRTFLALDLVDILYIASSSMSITIARGGAVYTRWDSLVHVAHFQGGISPSGISPFSHLWKFIMGVIYTWLESPVFPLFNGVLEVTLWWHLWLVRFIAEYYKLTRQKTCTQERTNGRKIMK